MNESIIANLIALNYVILACMKICFDTVYSKIPKYLSKLKSHLYKN